MTRRLAILPAVFVFGMLHASASLGGDPPAPDQPSFWIIPHTHWEGAVFKTREEYLEMGLPHILRALHLLKTQPEYRFVLDQVAYVKPFLDRYPEQEADFRRFVEEGRLELVLGLDVMPDVNMPGGETFVRQMQYGKGYYREKLGVDVTAAWLIDTFGHHAQMPQLLRKAGYTSFWFSRGVPKPDHPSEFLWEGIDGTRIAAFWLPFSYGLMYGSPRDPTAFGDFVAQRFGMLTPNARGPERLGLAGVDVCDPEEHLAPMVAAYNARPDPPVHLRIAVPSEFEAVAARRTDRPVFRGELNPIFQGTYSSRIELKHWMRTMERRLLTAEKLDVVASQLGAKARAANLDRAWEPVLFNETHDLASGVMTDHVYEDTIGGYEYSRRLADEMIDQGMTSLADLIDTRGEGVPVVVFNPLGWTRSDAVEVTVGFDDERVGGLAVLDPEGREIPAQTLEASRYGNGGLRQARIAFIARDIPPIGHAVFHVVARDQAGPPEAAAVTGEAMINTMVNGLYTLTIDRATGAVTSLRVNDGDWEALSGRANVVARQEDKGDLWELYRGLDGGSKIAMTTRQEVPKPGQAKLSDQFRGEPGTLRVGPVFSEFQVAHPFDSGTFATTIRVYQGLPRIEFTTTLVNQEKYVRYQALFPTTIDQGRTTHEIPFGAIERPEGSEFPAQNWADLGDGRRGVAVLNVGLPGNVTTGGTLMVSLMRSHNLGQYGFGGGYEPGMSSESGFEVGQARSMRYALMPHNGDWRDAGVHRAGLEFNHPLLARKATTHDGRPGRSGLIDVSKRDVVVSSLKSGRDGGVYLRVYEATGRKAEGVRVRVKPTLQAASEASLLEGEQGAIPVNNDAVTFDLAPFEIKTFRLRWGVPVQ
jgi:alpha-mannosidase